jgi:hypothetical protein
MKVLGSVALVIVLIGVGLAVGFAQGKRTQPRFVVTNWNGRTVRIDQETGKAWLLAGVEWRELSEPDTTKAGQSALPAGWSLAGPDAKNGGK